jgi:hypothetical protein
MKHWSEEMKIHALPLMIAVALTSACAQAASPPAAAPTPKAAAPATDPAAARAEIDRLIARIQELSRQLGDDTRVQVERRRFDGMGPPPPPGAPGDGREIIIERHRMDGSPMRGDMMHGERFPGAMMAPNSAGIGVVLAPNQAATGVRIAAVTPDSPAMKAGLRTGDVLLSVDGKKVAGSGSEGVESARHLLGGLKKDQIVRLGYAREGKTGEAAVKADNIRRLMMFNRGGLGDMPGMPAMSGDDHGDRHFRVFAPEIDAEIEQGLPMKHCAPGNEDCAMPAMFEAFRWQGLNLASVDGQLGHYFGADRGVLVLSNGAELKGLQSGDVIQRVAGNEVNTPRDVMRSLREKSVGSQLKLDVLRDRKAMTLTVTVPEARALPFMAPPPPPAPPAPPAPPTPRVPGVAPPAPPAPPHAPGVAPPPPPPPVPPNTSCFAPPSPPAPPAPPTPAALPPPPPPQAPLAMMDAPGDGSFVGDIQEQRYVDDNGEEKVDVTITPSN